MGFWDVLWLMVWAFVFIAYLMVLWQVVIDIFADKDLNGWLKALWIIFLVAVPWLTALVYLIARGKGMTRRQHAGVAARQQAAEDYIRSVSGVSPAEQIKHAKDLLDSGAITAEEFARLKTKALG